MKKNEEIIQELKNKKLPIFIYGNGEVGQLCKMKIEQLGGKVEAFVVDGLDCDTNAEYSVEQLKGTYQEFAIVRGFLNALYMPVEQLESKFGAGCKGIYSLSGIYDGVMTEEISAKFYEENKNDFNRIRNALYDDQSKHALDCFLKAKIEQDDSWLISCVKPIQYFFDYPCWTLDEDEVLLDCGAYDGDSIADYYRIKQNDTGKIIAFEPDGDNVRKLIARIESNNWNNVEVIQKVLSKQPGILRFNARGDMESRIQESGDIELEADSIDHVVYGQKVTIIKMDIEGSEMDALIGAEKTIKKWRPMLFISAYHKKHDLIDIFDYVNGIDSTYEWFFYIHKPLTVDAVLYAIPKHRITKKKD